MSLICLILSGGALLINGLGLLGRIPARDSGYFTVLIGSTQLALSALIARARPVDASKYRQPKRQTGSESDRPGPRTIITDRLDDRGVRSAPLAAHRWRYK